MSAADVPTAEPVVVPLFDTWGLQKDAAHWCIEPNLDHQDESVAISTNAWLAEVVQRTFGAFEEVARPWRTDFSAVDASARAVLLDWTFPEPPRAYIARVLDEVRRYPYPIHSVESQVDVAAFVRTVDSPSKPTPRWVRLPTSFTFWAPGDGVPGSVCLDLEHSLFARESVDFDDNTILYKLNGPVLASALRRWAATLGPFSETGGYAELIDGFTQHSER